MGRTSEVTMVNKKKAHKKRKSRKGLTFAHFAEVNKKRANGWFVHNLDAWSPAEWGCALAGEVGELCNFLKKMLRGDGDFTQDCAKELGDVVTYAFLVADKLGIDLEKAVVEKFNEVSDRIDFKNIHCTSLSCDGDQMIADSVSDPGHLQCMRCGEHDVRLVEKPAPRL